MSEYIEREKAQDGLDNIDWYHVNDNGQLLPGGKTDIETYVPFKAVEEMLKSIPAADVRPVVLCRDCKHKGWVQEPEHGKSVDYCRLIERCVAKQFFCAAGKRADDA